MNCQDISAILDDRDIEGLSSAERHAIDRHLEDCRQCAREWAAHERLIASPVPPMPGRLGQRLHELARSVAPARRLRRAGGRPIVVAGLMLLGAAAAALVGVDFFGNGNPEPGTGPMTGIYVEAPVVTDDSADSAREALPEPSTAVSEASASPQAEADGSADAAGFTVAVSPLIHVTEDSTVASIAETIYRAMLDELRTVPNLTLIEPPMPNLTVIGSDASIAMPAGGAAWPPSFAAASNGSQANATALEEVATERDEAGNRIVFELEPVFALPTTGVAPAAEGNVVFDEVIAHAIGSRTVVEGATAAGSSIVDVFASGGVTQSVRIDPPAKAAGYPAEDEPGYDYLLNVTSSGRNDPATGTLRSLDFNVVAAAMDGAGGIITFGISANLYESYDPSAMARQVVTQLQKLLFEPTESTVEALQSDVLDRTAAIDSRLGALSELRMIALRSGVDGRVSELVPAVIDMAVKATDAGQRAWIWELIRGSDDQRLVAPLVDSLLYDADEMVRLEAARTLVTFPDDPTAVAALEQAGRFDASEDVSLFARWTTMTESEHRDHVASALLDTSLSDAERIAPLSFAARYPYGVGAAELVRGMDAEASSALVELIARTADPALRADLMQHLARADQTDVTDFLIDRLSADSSEFVRSLAVHSLRDRADRANVRLALENASANDASPMVRGLATLALGTIAN